MADASPNYIVEMQRLRAQIAAQRSTIEAQRLAILEMVDRKRRHEENIQAALRAIAEYDAQLKGLEATHGVLTPDVFQQMSVTLSEGGT